MKDFRANTVRVVNSMFNIGFFKEIIPGGQVLSQLFVFSIVMYMGFGSASAQLNSTSSQTISTNQTYTGASAISNGSTVTISGGTTTFNGTLTAGNSNTGTLIVKSGATVIVNGTVAIGTASNGSIIIESGGRLIVNPGASNGTTAISINSSATTGLDVQAGGSVIVNRATPSTNTALGLVITNSSKATIAGSMQIRGGGLSMNGTSKLTYSGAGNDTIIGDPNASAAYFSNNTVLTVGSGVNLYVKGNVKNDSYAEFAIDGNVSINGNYQSGNNTANITGEGNITTTGSLNADSYQGSVFGDRYTCPTGPCDGRRPCGQTATSSPALTTLCSGPSPTTLSVSFTYTGSAAKTYQWQSSTSLTGAYSNITSATNATYVATPSTNTFYRVAITVSGCITYSSKASIIVGKPTAGTITATGTACAGASVTYSIPNIPGATGYTWTVPSGATISSGAGTNSIAVVMGSTNGNVTVAATNACGTGTASSLAVTVNTLPAAAGSITGVVTACQGTSQTFSISAVTGATGYSWTLPSGTTISSGSNTVSITANIGGTSGNIVVAATNACGSGTSSSLAFTAVASRPAGPTGFSGPTTVCAGSTQNYSVAAASDATSYSWSLPSGATILSGANTNSVTIKFGTASNSIVVTPSNICGTGYSSLYQYINVNATTSTSPGVTAAASATTICAGASITLTATPSNGGAAPAYQWRKGGVAISGATTATYITTTAANGDSYTVTLTNNALCPNTATSSAVVITVNPSVTPSVTVASTSTNICSGASITLTATPANGGTTPTYQWKKGGAPISGAINATYTTSAAVDNDSYTVTMTSNAACATPASATSSAVVATVTAIPTIVSTTPANRCGSGSITLGAAPSAGGTINWYTASTGGTSVGAGTGYATTISTTTTFYVDATNNSCTTSSRTAVVATVNACTIDWTGATSTDWNTTSNWSSSSVPTTIDDVVIPSSVATGRMPVIDAGADAKNINNSGTITLTSAGVLNVYGNISSTGTVTTVAGSTVSFNGSTAQTVNGVSSLHNVKMNNTAGGVSLSSALTVRGTLSLTKGVLTTNSKLTINFDNGGNIAYVATDAGSISGTVSGRRDLSVRTHYIAAPFSGSTSAQVQATTPLYQNTYWRMYTKDFAAQTWTAVTTTTASMPLGTGFSLTLAAPAPLILSGTYSHNSTFTGPGYSNAAAGKMFMVGNPYPSTLDWDNAGGWTKTNVGGSIYYWDPTNTRVASYVSGVGTNGGTRYVPAMQAFHVVTTGTGGTSGIAVNNIARTTQNSSYFRVVQDDVIRVHLISGTDSTRNDETVIRFNEEATSAFDFDLDAYKLLNSGGMPSVYTTSGQKNYSVNSYTSVDSARYIPLAAKIGSDGMYTLKITGTNPYVEYILVDKLLGTSQSIEQDSSYAFSGLRTDDVNRFELQLRVSEIAVPTGVHSSNKNAGLGIYSSSKGFVIKTDRYAGDEAEIEILDMTGNSVQVLSGMNLSSGSTYVPLDMADGAYLIKIRVDGTTFAGMIALVK